MSDSPIFSVSKTGIADTLSIAESLDYSFTTSASDSVTITESIAVILTSGGSSVLNTSALNTSALN
jgi:hypothetical protein